MFDAFNKWFREVHQPTMRMAWDAGAAYREKELKAQMIAIIEQNSLLARDFTIIKISEAIRDL